MPNGIDWKASRIPSLALLGRLTVWAFALIGFFWLAGDKLLRLFPGPHFTTDVVRRVSSPDRAAIAEVEVQKGGMGTVWTTRVLMRRTGQPPWTVYQNHDSAFIPPLRWLSRNTLLIGLPCGRFDHLSNPDDWETAEPRPRRLRVRFRELEQCL